MGKVLVVLPSRRLEVKGKPDVLASFPWGAGVLVSWSELNELPVSTGSCGVLEPAL